MQETRHGPLPLAGSGNSAPGLPSPTRVAVLISGRGSNMEALLHATAAPLHVALVISNCPGAPGLAIAREAGVEALCLDHRPYGRARPAHENSASSTPPSGSASSDRQSSEGSVLSRDSGGSRNSQCWSVRASDPITTLASPDAAPIATATRMKATSLARASRRTATHDRIRKGRLLIWQRP